MRIMWLAPTSGLLERKEIGSSYYGGGWVASLQRIVEREGHELALAYVSHQESNKTTQGKTTYYPIHMPSPSQLQKLWNYYGRYKNRKTDRCVNQLLSAIEEYQPDVIHLFGSESPFACILGKTKVSVVVHLQGLLSPCDNAFFPPGINKSSFLFPFSIREWILRNGYIYAHKSICHRGKAEHQLFKKIQYTMGRTEWDKKVSHLLAPNSQYFHVDEMLREGFYQHAGEWKPKQGKLVLCSTISDTVYKGLDLILKTASLLKNETDIDFEWRIIGLNSQARIIRFFEKTLAISSQDVNVCYAGVQPEGKLIQSLLASSIYVHPSYIDNSPNSLCEAQLLGLPVIATYVGGIPTLIDDGNTGFLIPANAPYELAYQIMELHRSPKQQVHIGCQAAEVARRRHSPQQIYCDLIHAYEQITK